MKMEIQDAWSGKSNFGPGSDTCRRRFGDRFSWIVPLPTEGIRTPETPDSVVEYSEFNIYLLGRDVSANAEDIIPVYQIVSRPFSSLALRYRYTYSCEVLLTFGHRLENLIRSEFLKIEPNKRPAALKYPDIVTRWQLWEAEFEQPESWTYYDDELHRWVDKMESLSRERMKNLPRNSDNDA